MMMQFTASNQSYSEHEVELFVQNGQHEKLLREWIFDLNHVFDNSGNSLLHLSAKHGNTHLTNILIKLGCNVNIQNKLGNTALMTAVLQKRLYQVKLLLEAKSDIYVTNTNGDSALKLSLRYLNDQTKLVIMKSLLEHVKNTTTNNEEIFDILTEANCSLTYAVFLNDIEVMKLMLQQNYDIHDRDCFNGWTALHVAVMENNREMVKLLVQHGYDVNIPDAYGNLPLNYVFDYGMVQCSEVIRALMPTDIYWTDLSYPAGTMNFRSAFVKGTKETLQLFLQSYQIDWTAKDIKGMTALHYLASNCNDGIFDLYQNVDFDVNARDKIFRKTALHISAVQGSVEGMKFLLARGADVNATDDYGCTPLFYAISRRNIRDNKYKECIELLAQYDANLQVVTSEEDSIFRRASRCQNYFLIEPLLAHLAIDETAGTPIKTLILDHIHSDSHLKKHYDFCKNELKKMKTTTIFGTVTLWKFLSDNENKIPLYTRRKECFNKIMDGNFVSNSYYISLLRRRFNKGMEIDELRTKASLILNEAISDIACNHVIVNQIIGFLSYKDLLKLS